MISSDKIRIYERMLNAFENDSGSPETDYTTIYLYHDGNNKRKQVTLGRGFTEDGGSLRRVIALYIMNHGELAPYFSSKIDSIGRASASLANDPEFIRNLKTASASVPMKDAQDSVFHSVYMEPALKWADLHGFKLPLSVAVIVDSYLHSGGMLGWLMKRFPESKPDNGGDEKTWIAQYVDARHNWLSSASALLRNTTYRTKFFKGEIAKTNWNFDCPLVANGSKIC